MEEDLITCPFDPNHKIRPSRFENHVIKCRKHYGNIGIEMCPFNAKHIMTRLQIRNHIMVCPDRTRLVYEASLIETHRKNLENTEDDLDSIITNETTSTYQNPFGEEENWDNHVNPVDINQPRRLNVNSNLTYSSLAPKDRKMVKLNAVEKFKEQKEGKNVIEN
ncbi:gametocyte-specific factor 1-like [Brachionus plicatilis]|uniref:Gametocyte-specific factor 1-like n=1 Tax=Brachionus plicatilis TaxID=10195 RepID=A0A3M7S3K6_BRAPC|nr:gametocyte-specific factor 1-like [Brachionus plicatilis]